MMLETQYRMHPVIAEYSSWRFYDSRLLTDHKLIDYQTHVKVYHQSSLFQPFVFHDVFFGRQSYSGTSISNRAEAEYIAELFQKLRSRYASSVDPKAIGIIAPYAAQRQLLHTLFRDKFGKKHGVEISTIDGFQGREKDIIIFSCTRAPSVTSNAAAMNAAGSETAGIGFLKEKQRLNVAITRAKYAVWIVGCRETLIVDSEWSQLITYCKGIDGVVLAKQPQPPATAMRKESVKPIPKPSHHHYHQQQQHQHHRATTRAMEEPKAKHYYQPQQFPVNSNRRPPILPAHRDNKDGDYSMKASQRQEDTGHRDHERSRSPPRYQGACDSQDYYFERPATYSPERNDYSGQANQGYYRDPALSRIMPPALTVPAIPQHHRASNV
jgi:hypothetical protein